MKPVLAIIFGGATAEHEISLLSAMHVIENIDHSRYDVLQIGIDQESNMYAGPQVLMTLKHNLDRSSLAPCMISTNGHFPGVMIFPPGKPAVFQKVNIFFPLTHGPLGEDGTLQGVLEYSKVPYVSSGVLGSALAMDKIISKKIFATYRLPQVPFLPFRRDEIQTDLLSVCDAITRDLHFPLYVKPANLGSHLGIRKVTNLGKLEDALEYACKYSDRIIVEQGLGNIRELSCAVIGDYHLEISKVGEVTSASEFYDKDTKYHGEAAQVLIPAPLDSHIVAEIQSMAQQAFRILHLRGMARIDFFLNGNQVFINNVNTIPSFSSTSLFCKLFASEGIDIKQLIQKLIDISLQA
jgi:D-alanine-D-alanine ligase